MTCFIERVKTLGEEKADAHVRYCLCEAVSIGIWMLPRELPSRRRCRTCLRPIDSRVSRRGLRRPQRQKRHAVEILNVPDGRRLCRRYPVTAGLSPSQKASAFSRMTRAKATSSAAVSPFIRSAVRNPATCASWPARTSGLPWRTGPPLRQDRSGPPAFESRR